MAAMIRWLLIVCCLVLATPVQAAIYIVDKNHGAASDSYNTTQAQSESTPWRTIQKCLNTVTAGNTCQVKNGVYAEAVTLISSGTSDTNRIIVENFPGHAPIIDGTGLNNHGVCIRCNATVSQTIAYVTWRGFEIRNSVFTGIKFKNANNLIIERNYVHDNGLSATGSGSAGIQGVSGINVTIRSNHVHHNGGNGTPRNHCFYISGSNYFIVNNIITYCLGSGMQTRSVPTSLGPTAAYNNFDNNIIANNTFAYMQFSAGVIMDPNGGSMTNNQFINNIFYQNADLSAGSPNGIQVNTGVTGTVAVKNNISYSTVGPTNFFMAPTCGANCTLSNNCPTSQAANCGTQPQMVNAPANIPASPDYSLVAGSLAINFGTPVSGLTANGLPDAGAFESLGGFSAASVSGNNIDVTIGMSVNTPLLPATGQTGWTVNNGRTVTSAVKLSGTDSVVRLTFDGAACTGGQTWTVSYSPGNVSDSAKIWTANQKLFAFSNQPVTNDCGGGGSSPPGTPHIIYPLNDGSGTTASDTSGNNLHGTLSATAPTWVTGTIDGALDFADQTDNYVTVPYGSGVNPTTQSVTVCMLVAPDSTTNNRDYMGPPPGGSENQYSYLSIKNGTWAIGVQTNGAATNNEFPVQAGYSLVCMEFDAVTDRLTLIVNAVRGTTTSGNGASVKTMTSFTWAGNWTFGKASGHLTSTAPGCVVDHVVLYTSTLTQQQHTDLYQSLVTPSPPPPSSTREQKGHKFQRPFKKAGVAEDLRGVDEEARVSRGGYVDVVIQLDCTGDDCPSFAPRIHRSIDGGATYAQINDVCGVICFRGTSTDPDLVSADVTCCLTGALTEVDGPTNFSSAAVPNITLVQDSSITLRYKLKVAADATVGQEIYLKVFDQNGNELEGGYTPALGAKLTVKDYANGGGF